MDLTKSWFQSTTIQAAIVNFLLLVVMAFKLDIKQDEITAIVTGVFGIITTIAIIYGRIKAQSKIK